MPEPLSDAEIAARIRAGTRCLLHPPPREGSTPARADQGYTTCSACADRLRDVLKDITERYLKLNPAPGGSAEHGGRGSPGFGSRPPASLHVLAMTDPRSGDGARVWLAADGRVHHESEHPPLSVRNVLETIAVDIAEQRDVAPPKLTVPDLARFIDANLDWLTRQPHIADVGEQLRRLAGQLRPVTGDARRRIGICPNTIDDGDHTRPCEASLHAPLGGSDSIHCRVCGRVWPRSEWLRLGDLLDAS